MYVCICNSMFVYVCMYTQASLVGAVQSSGLRLKRWYGCFQKSGALFGTARNEDHRIQESVLRAYRYR